MFAYNPTVNDRSGEILGAYTASAAQTRAEGMQNFGQSIGQGLAGLGGGIGGMVKDARDKTAKLEGIAATGEALNAILPTYGKEGVAIQTALEGELTKAGNNPDKLAGAMMAFMPAVENLQSRYNQKAQIDGYKELYTQKAQASADAKADLPPKLDANYARQAYQSLRGRGYSHEQAIEGMNAGGMNWGVQYINRPESNPFWGSNP